MILSCRQEEKFVGGFFIFLILPTFVMDKQIDIKIEWEKEN